jgi:hypothetical protein
VRRVAGLYDNAPEIVSLRKCHFEEAKVIVTVYLALEPAAALQAVQLAKKEGAAVWIGSDALSDEEIKTFRRDGVNLTRFAYPLSHATIEDITSALGTIEEHHPNETVWVQHLFRKFAA